ncbi:MAG: acetate--CoA ligase family protein [Rhodospirillales bacterium]|nr:acetate--CoA ligase family protein [Rhodospirillales bacterium]
MIHRPDPHKLDPLFKPGRVVFVGGRNLAPALKYHSDLGFAGDTWVVHPRYDVLEGYSCFSTIEDLPESPDLAFVAINREAAIEALAVLRRKGCRAVVCNAAGFAETGEAGHQLQQRLIAAAGDMAMLGPNAIGLVNYADPMAAMMDRFGVHRTERGVAIVSQGGGFLCDAVFSDRGLAITHMVGCGNQAAIGVAACVDYLLDDPRVSAVGLSFEGLHDILGLRRAAVKSLKLGKPIVALKFGKTAAGAQAAVSHTASMAGAAASWEALFDRLGIVSTASESEFFETLKLVDSGQMPHGRRVLVTAVSGVMGVMLADHLTAAGFDLPQPGGECAGRLRELLPDIATPCNPQDVTMAAWNDKDRQEAVYSALLDEGYDVALMVQNYPREGMWDMTEYEAQVAALGAACMGRGIASLQLAPMVDCFPLAARKHTQDLGLAAMQGLEECIKALSHAVRWRERREELCAEGVGKLVQVNSLPPSGGQRCDEAVAKSFLRQAGVPVPVFAACDPEQAADKAVELGFPVALKALDARLLHKTEVGAVRIGLKTRREVAGAVARMREDMARLAPGIAFGRVLVETMAPDAVAEIMASVTFDPATGPMMTIAGGGVEAELWNDSALLAAPFTRHEIERALNRLKTNKKLAGWRSAPAGDRAALLDMLEALAGFAAGGKVEEIEINPILVGRKGALAVDAVLKLNPTKASR